MVKIFIFFKNLCRLYDSLPRSVKIVKESSRSLKMCKSDSTWEEQHKSYTHHFQNGFRGVFFSKCGFRRHFGGLEWQPIEKICFYGELSLFNLHWQSQNGVYWPGRCGERRSAVGSGGNTGKVRREGQSLEAAESWNDSCNCEGTHWETFHLLVSEECFEILDRRTRKLVFCSLSEWFVLKCRYGLDQFGTQLNPGVKTQIVFTDEAPKPCHYPRKSDLLTYPNRYSRQRRRKEICAELLCGCCVWLALTPIVVVLYFIARATGLDVLLDSPSIYEPVV